MVADTAMRMRSNRAPEPGLRLNALVAHARSAPAEGRAALANELRRERQSGCVFLETCHRVEIYSHRPIALPAGTVPPGVDRLSGTAVARHAVRLAVGLESAVVGEDEVLHQLRRAVQQARDRGPLPPGLDRMLDVALRAGRRARSWLPAQRRGLADVALERFIGRTDPPAGLILVVGAGEMGRRSAQTLAARGSRLAVASRTPERGRALALEVGAEACDFDPGSRIAATVAGVVLALGGRWLIAPATRKALIASGAWVVDLSAPPALDTEMTDSLGPRLASIDDLAAPREQELSARLLARLEELVDETVAGYAAWDAHATQRSAARALSARARAVQTAELNDLWRRAPDLDSAVRSEVERMARRLTERLLRDPLERLRDDGDGRQASAARDLFRL
jgi:glutamyl-tRNA reductase